MSKTLSMIIHFCVLDHKWNVIIAEWCSHIVTWVSSIEWDSKRDNLLFWRLFYTKSFCIYSQTQCHFDQVSIYVCFIKNVTVTSTNKSSFSSAAEMFHSLWITRKYGLLIFLLIFQVVTRVLKDCITRIKAQLL